MTEVPSLATGPTSYLGRFRDPTQTVQCAHGTEAGGAGAREELTARGRSLFNLALWNPLAPGEDMADEALRILLFRGRANAAEGAAGRAARGLVPALALAALVGACSREDRSQGAGATATARVNAAASTSAPQPATSQRPSPAPSALAEQTAAERKALVRYQRALERGRLATTRKQFSAAEIAFTEALEARPHDARALAERGYARLRAERFDDADADLAEAQGRTADKVLNAQVYFNRGLVAERRGQAVLARDYFAFSLEANPTTAARGKLAGKSTCPASVQVPGEYEAALEVFSNLDGTRRALRLDPADWARAKENLTTNEAVRESLGLEDCHLGCGASADGSTWHLLWEMPDGRVAALRELDEGYYYRCGAPPSITGHPAGKYLWVTSENVELITGSCGFCDEDYCPSCCWDGPWHRYDVFVDKESLRVLLRVEQHAEESENRKEAELTFQDGVVRLQGKGCDWTVPLDEDAPPVASAAPVPSASAGNPPAPSASVVGAPASSASTSGAPVLSASTVSTAPVSSPR